MNEQRDCLEETWEIKKQIARQYAGIAMSQQLREMHNIVVEEFQKRGWNYPGPPSVAKTHCGTIHKPLQ